MVPRYRYPILWNDNADQVLGYNHIPYFNCPASKNCRGCDAGKFFGNALAESRTDLIFIEGTGLGPENCKPLWDKVIKQGTPKKTWKADH